MDFQALLVTLKLAILTVLFLLALGLPCAYWIATTTSRFKWLVEAGISLPLVLPPTVLGFYLLIAFGRFGVGNTLANLTGIQLPFSFNALLIGSVLFNFPLAVRPFVASFASVPSELVEASWCLGKTKWQTFKRITVPLAMPGILAGTASAFANTLGEFGVVLMVGGNIPGETRTLSILIYDQMQSLDYQAANQTAIVLILLSVVTMVGLRIVSMYMACIYAPRKRT
jgi:molybdate transport system permease protein